MSNKHDENWFEVIRVNLIQRDKQQLVNENYSDLCKGFVYI